MSPISDQTKLLTSSWRIHLVLSATTKAPLVARFMGAKIGRDDNHPLFGNELRASLRALKDVFG